MTTSEIRNLSDRLGDVTAAVTTLEAEMVTENRLRRARIESAEKATRWARRIAVVGVVVGLIGVSIGGSAHSAANSAKASLAETKRATMDARVGTCHQYNIGETKARAAEKAEIRTLVNALAPPPRSPDVAKTVNRFYPKYDAIVEASHPLRDCTPKGIDEYLKTNP